MVNMPSCEYAVELARKNGFFDNVALHLNLTEGYPLTEAIRKCRRFCDNAVSFTRFGRKWRFMNRFEVSAMIDEVRAQIQKYCSYGFPLMRVDGHNHVEQRLMFALYLIPEFRKLGVLSVRGICQGSCMFKSAGNYPDKYTKARVLAYCAYCKLCKMKCEQIFCGWASSSRYIELLREFANTNLQFEFMVHPVFNEAGDVVDSCNAELSGPLMSDIMPSKA